MWGSITGAVTEEMTSPYCFVAGTPVCTVDGEEFTTTESHPFYTLERGFVKAGELRYSDTLVDAKGNKLYLEKKNKEHLTKPVTVYNFAVEDYHTYFVGENEILVHNICGLQLSNNETKKLALGLSDYLDDFAKANGAETWKNFADPLNWKNGVNEAFI